MTAKNDRSRIPADRETSGERADSPATQGRSTAEWTTLGVSLLILFGVASLVTYLYAVEGREEPIIIVQPRFAEMRHDDNVYYLPVSVTNQGDRTAADVRIRGEIPTDTGEPETAEFEIAFVAGQETVDGTLIFSQEPIASQLQVLPVSFMQP